MKSVIKAYMTLSLINGCLLEFSYKLSCFFNEVTLIQGVIMRKFFGVIVLSVFIGSIATAQESDIRSTAHPLIGYWESIDANTGCKESYQFNSNGKGVFVSGKEESKVIYQVSPQPNIYGFFKLQHTVESSNGEQDCTQSKSKLNEQQTSYILFQPDGHSFIACDNDEASLETCFGPVVLKAKAQ